jgi:hypothetical protein
VLLDGNNQDNLEIFTSLTQSGFLNSLISLSLCRNSINSFHVFQEAFHQLHFLFIVFQSLFQDQTSVAY